MTRISDDNPFKHWECEACATVNKGYYLSKKGGICPECGHDGFTEVDPSESVWEWEERE